MALDSATSSRAAFRGPLIVTGMHRSGTSMLSRLLDRLGVFQGHDVRGGNHEAALFYTINEWLLRQAGAAWDRPLPVNDLTADPNLVALTARYVGKHLESAQLVDYLGPTRWVRHRRLANLPMPWGFKDPRTVFTLPVWFELFPDARVLYIHRNGVDVAASLERRTLERLRRSEDTDGGRLSRRARFSPRPRVEGHLALSLRCRTLRGGFELWKEYCEEGERQLERLPADRKLMLAYEDLASDPAKHLAAICRLAGIEEPPRMRDLVADLVRRDRVDGFRRQARLSAFHETVRNEPCMVRLGYGEASPVRHEAV